MASIYRTFCYCCFLSVIAFRASNAFYIFRQVVKKSVNSRVFDHKRNFVAVDDGKDKPRRSRQHKQQRLDTNVATTTKATTTRRLIIANSCGLIAAAGVIAPPDIALAAAPITAKDTDSVFAIAKRRLRPKPPKILRKKLSQNFAVLLMRSSYNALDEIDCIAMDQFQRDFFLFRASEYETYTNNLGAGMVTQGDLTDPYYFDFISFAQYKTINREINNDPPYVFKEQQQVQLPDVSSSEERRNDGGQGSKARFVSVLVQRDPNLTNQMLVPTHSSKVGSAILNKLDETFTDYDTKIPKVDIRPDSETLFSAIQRILTLFLINGYAFKGDVVAVADSTGALAKYVITLTAPVTLWGGRIMQLEGDPLDNNFLLKAITEYIRRSGYETTSKTKFDGPTQEITIIVTS